MKVQARCTAKAFESTNAVMYCPGEILEIDLSDLTQRKLADLRTPTGGWVFEFDRANANNPQVGLFFCKGCGQRFDHLNEIGLHRLHLKDDRGNPNPCRVKTARDAEPGMEPADQAEEEDDQPVEIKHQGRKAGQAFACKKCGESVLNLHELKVHHREKHPVVPEESE